MVNEDLKDLYRPRRDGMFYKMRMIEIRLHPLRQDIGKNGRLIVCSRVNSGRVEIVLADKPCAGFWSLLRKPGRVYCMYQVKVPVRAGFFEIMELIRLLVSICFRRRLPSSVGHFR